MHGREVEVDEHIRGRKVICCCCGVGEEGRGRAVCLVCFLRILRVASAFASWN